MLDESVVDTPETPLPDRLPDHLLAYWQKVVEGMGLAQQELEHVARLEQQVAQFRQQATARMGAYESYLVHLNETLGLDPQTDRIEPDGRIVRAPGGPPLNGRAA
jgi:hypothetical protein